MTEERTTPNASRDAQKQRRSSFVGKARLAGSISFDKEPDNQNAAVKPKYPASRNSLDVPSPSEDMNVESNSLINREKQNSGVVIARTDQSRQHQDRSLAFIR